MYPLRRQMALFPSHQSGSLTIGNHLDARYAMYSAIQQLGVVLWQLIQSLVQPFLHLPGLVEWREMLSMLLIIIGSQWVGGEGSCP